MNHLSWPFPSHLTHETAVMSLEECSEKEHSLSPFQWSFPQSCHCQLKNPILAAWNWTAPWLFYSMKFYALTICSSCVLTTISTYLSQALVLKTWMSFGLTTIYYFKFKMGFFPHRFIHEPLQYPAIFLWWFVFLKYEKHCSAHIVAVSCKYE